MTARILADGRWLLELEGRRFLLPSELGRRLLHDGPPRELIEYCRRARPPRRFAVRAVLFPAHVVQCLTKPLTGLAAWPVLLLGLIGGGGFLAGVWSVWRSQDFSWPLVLVWIVALALWHELGHATALRRGGGLPGAVGVGWVVVVPAFWCDVSEVGLLGRIDRLRVDLAGVAWQLGAAAVVTALGEILECWEMVVAGRAALMASAWSLLPLVRTDGAWALADMLDLPALEEPLPRGASKNRLAIAAGVRWVSAILLVAVAGLLPWRLARSLGFLWGGPPTVDILVSVGVGLLGFVFLAVAIRKAAGLIRAVRLDGRPPGSGNYSS